MNNETKEAFINFQADSELKKIVDQCLEDCLRTISEKSGLDIAPAKDLVLSALRDWK